MQTVIVKNTAPQTQRYTVQFDSSDNTTSVETFDLATGQDKVIAAVKGTFKLIKVENVQ